MNVIWITLACVFIAGIVLIRGSIFAKEKTRKEYLDDMAEYFQGSISPLEGHANSFKVNFKYGDFEFNEGDS